MCFSVLTSSPGPPPGASASRLAGRSGDLPSLPVRAELMTAWLSSPPVPASPYPWQAAGPPPDAHTHTSEDISNLTSCFQTSFTQCGILCVHFFFHCFIFPYRCWSSSIGFLVCLCVLCLPFAPYVHLQATLLLKCYTVMSLFLHELLNSRTSNEHFFLLCVFFSPFTLFLFLSSDTYFI